MLDNPNDFGRGALAVMRTPAPGLAVTVRPAPSTHSTVAQPAAMPGSAIDKTCEQGQVLQLGLQSDLRNLPFAERALIPHAELIHMADADVPGAETEICLRATLQKTGVAREKTKPHSAA